MKYKYSDLQAGLSILEQQLQYIAEQDRRLALYRYVKQWRRFYGLTSKYNGKGELRENTTTV